MGWWQKLFGRSPARAPRRTPAGPEEIELIAGELSVRVTAHAIPTGASEVPCWTYVTSGMWALGQKEFVLSLRRRPGEPDFPADPLDFFVRRHGYSAQGRLVDIGSHTCFREPGGFLGKTDQIGFVYVRPEKLRGVDLPPDDRCLTAILITADEAEVVHRLRSYRVTSLLGQANRYYPCPPWSDRDRPSVLTPADFAESMLSKMVVVHCWGSSVRTFLKPTAPTAEDRLVGPSGGDICLRVPETRRAEMLEVLDLLSEEGGGVVMTDPDPEANVRLYWRPGQSGTAAITAHSSDGSCVTGGFVALLFGESLTNGGRTVEDGFAVTLSPNSWARVREAVAAGDPIRVPAADLGEQGFALEWTPAAPVLAADLNGAFSVAQFFLYQPDEVLRQRVADVGTMSDYFSQVTAAAADYWAAQPPGPGQVVTLFGALKPGGKRRFWIELRPGGLDAGVIRSLLTRLEELPAPVVRQGPVAVAIHATLWGAAGGQWATVPREWQEACDGGSRIVPDGVLEVVWPD
jgi:hypothetical protein